MVTSIFLNKDSKSFLNPNLPISSINGNGHGFQPIFIYFLWIFFSDQIFLASDDMTRALRSLTVWNVIAAPLLPQGQVDTFLGSDFSDFSGSPEDSRGQATEAGGRGL